MFSKICKGVLDEWSYSVVDYHYDGSTFHNLVEQAEVQGEDVVLYVT